MRNVFLNFLVLMFSTVVFSQSVTYKGKIVDERQTPISYADVLAMDDNNSIIEGVITDNNGDFKLEIVNNASVDHIEISFIGFETQIIKPNTFELGTIVLKEEATELKEIVIVARKRMIDQKVDRLVFNVENSVSSSNGSALDLLKVTPSVQVNNNSINIIGKSGARVLINDRIVQLSGEELASYLNSFSSDDIKNIEVITTPPAKYEAEGNGGLINIVLKKPKENSWNNQIRASYVQTTYPAIKLGNTFNYSHQKWKVFASLDGKKGNEQSLAKMNIHYPDQVWRDTIKTKHSVDYVSGKLGVDYQINERSVIGLFYSGEYKKPNSIENSTTYITSDSNILLGKIVNNGNMKQKNVNNILNVHYSQKLDTLGREMFIDLDYFNYKNTKDREFTSEQLGNHTSFQMTNNTGVQNIENYSAKVDFQHPTKFANFSYGGKIARTKTNNDVNFYDLSNGSPVFSQNKSNVFKYIEDIQALYLDISKNFSESLQAKLGLRSEFTQTEGISKNLSQVDRKKYVQLFPTLYLSYTKDRNNMFNLSLNRRISRPSFSRLNPFKFYTNANSYVEGNPSLQPSFSNEIRFKYIYKRAFITELFYSYIQDVASQVPRINVSKNQQYYTFQNVGNLQIFGATQTILYNPFSWWNTTNIISGFYQNTKTSIDVGTNRIFNGWKLQLYSNQVFSLNQDKTFLLESSFTAQSRGHEFLFETSPAWKLDLGLRMKFMDKKLQLTARLNDVFKTSSPDFTTYTNGIKQVYNTYNDNRYFTLGLSYNFGNDKIRVKEKELGNEDEVKRLD